MKICASNCGLPITRELLTSYQNAGIEYIEISFGNIEDYRKVDFDLVKALCDEFGIKMWSFHLSFSPSHLIDISSEDVILRQSSIEILTEQIIAASRIGIDKFIIHPSAEPNPDEKREERLNIAAKSLAHLSQIATGLGGVLCVENLPRTCLGRTSDEMLKLISLDNNLRVCFDTNHLLLQDPFSFIHDIGSKIITVHISDYDFIDEKHWLPGEGLLDFYGIYDELLKNQYQGVWNYEVTPFIASTKTIERKRELNLFDFAKNAEEIFSHSPITRLSL